MEVSDPVTRVIVPLTIGKRRVELPLETREECRALIRAIVLASGQLPDDGLEPVFDVARRGKTEPGDPAAAPAVQGAHPYPAGSLPVLSGRCAFGDHTACGIPGECDCPCRHDGEAEDAYVLTPAGEAAVDAPHPWYAGVDEEPCHGQHDDGAELWLCTAQAGHGGDKHVAYYADGEPLKTWPVRDAAHDTAGGTGPFAVPPGVDPMGPDAHKYHHPGCDCWDCRAYRSGETAEAARP